MKTILLAAILAASSGTVHAATLSYDMTLRYEGLLFKDTLITRETQDEENGVTVETVHQGDLWADQNAWGLQSTIGNPSKDTLLNLRLTVDVPDQYLLPGADPLPYPSPAQITSCSFGWIGCSGLAVYSLAPLGGMASDNGFLESGSAVGETLSYHYYAEYDGTRASYYDAAAMAFYQTFYDGVEARFTIIDIEAYASVAPAPVPLPASAALLIAGLGGLAAVRRRRA